MRGYKKEYKQTSKIKVSSFSRSSSVKRAENESSREWQDVMARQSLLRMLREEREHMRLAVSVTLSRIKITGQ